jgi:hypothetical protein
MKLLLSQKNLTHIVNYLTEAQTAEDSVSVFKVPFIIDGNTYTYYCVASKKTTDQIVPNLIAQAKNRYKNNKYKEIQTDENGQPTKPEDSYLYQWIVDRMITEKGYNVDDVPKRFFTDYFKQFFGQPELLTPEPIKRIDANVMRKELFNKDNSAFRSKMQSIDFKNKDVFAQEFKKITGKDIDTQTMISKPYKDFVEKLLSYGKERIGVTELGPNALKYWNENSEFKNDDPNSNIFYIVSQKPFKELITGEKFKMERDYEKISNELNTILFDPKITGINRKILGLSDAQTYRLIPLTRKLIFTNYIGKRKFSQTEKGTGAGIVPQSPLTKGKTFTQPITTKKSKRR